MRTMARPWNSVQRGRSERSLCSGGMRLDYATRGRVPTLHQRSKPWNGFQRGAMTFTRALQIRRLAAELPLDAIVLETDAPDIAPSWVHPGRNSPEELPAIGRVLAELRGVAVDEVRAATYRNALAAMPRLEAILES